MQGEALLNYRFSIREKHNFELLLGISMDKSQLFENDADALGTPSDYIHYIQGTTPIKYTKPEWVILRLMKPCMLLLNWKKR